MSARVRRASSSTQPLVQQAAEAASSLILFQLFSRAITFALNTLVLRSSSPQVLGMVSGRLDLLLNTVLFLSRDGLRMAMLRYPPLRPSPRPEEYRRWLRRFINMTWLAFPVGVVLSCGIAAFYIWYPPREIAGFAAATLLFILALLMELACEPFTLLFMYFQNFKLRISAESLALVVKAAVTAAIVLWRPSHDPLLTGLVAFPVAQLAHSLTLFGSFAYSICHHEEFEHLHLPDMLPTLPFLTDRPTVALAVDLTRQSLLKFALVQGDVWVVSIFGNLDAQGVYVAASNYGSLVCRLLLQPIEESSLNFFSRTLGPWKSTDALTEMETGPQVQARSKAALQYLALILRFYVVLALCFTCFAPFYTKTLIRLMLGRNWRESGLAAALSAYCFLIPVMGFSGIMEALVNATITRVQLSLNQKLSVAFSAIFVVLCVLLTPRFSWLGLIAANIVNFGLRLAYATIYFQTYLREHGSVFRFAEILPSPLTVAMFVTSGFVCGASSLVHSMRPLEHVLVGAVGFLLCVFVLWRFDKGLLQNIYELFLLKPKSI